MLSWWHTVMNRVKSSLDPLGALYMVSARTQLLPTCSIDLSQLFTHKMWIFFFYCPLGRWRFFLIFFFYHSMIMHTLEQRLISTYLVKTNSSIKCTPVLDWLIKSLGCFFGIEGHVTLYRYLRQGYDTLLLWRIPGDLSSACPHRQSRTLLGLWHSRAALSTSYPYACMPSWQALCTIFMIIFGITQQGREPMTYRMRGGHANHY